MRHVWVIARNTFSETIRDRVLYSILGFAAMYLLITIFLGKLALGNLVMIRSFGLAGVYLFGLVITIFLGSSIMHKEIERKTLYFVLTKPITRGEVIVGKFFGLFGAVALTNVFMEVFYLAVVAYQGGGLDSWAIVAFALQIIEIGLFIALLTLLSTVAAPLTATICALMVLAIGHLTDAMFHEARLIGGAAYLFGQVLHYGFPNLEKFNVRNLIVHDVAIPPFVLGVDAAYGILYIIGLLYVAHLLFRSKEL